MTTPEIVVSPTRPFAVEVAVFEEDTWCVLSAGTRARNTRESLVQLETQAVTQQPEPVGSIIKSGNRWYAIVHDVDAEPAYQPRNATRVLEQLAREIEQEAVRSISLQPPGAWHGPDSLDVAVERIRAVQWPTCLAAIWVRSRQVSP